jgi:hypothetical protein
MYNGESCFENIYEANKTVTNGHLDEKTVTGDEEAGESI